MHRVNSHCMHRVWMTPHAGTNMLAGTISWLGGCALWATSVEYCRRKFFELFYKTHIVGLITFFLFGYMHHISLWAYTMPGMSSSKCCSRDFIGDSQAA